MSARARIVGWMLLVVLIALAGSIAATAQVIATRADTLADDNLTHEAESFTAYATSQTGRSQSTVAGVLTRYMEDSVPDRAETFFSIVDGQPHRRPPVEPPHRLDTDESFVAAASQATEPEYGWIETPAGTARYGIIPVTVAGDDARGHIVIVQFRDQIAEPLYEALRIFILVAVVATVLAGIVSWLVAGRVLEPVRLVRQTADQISETDLRRRIPIEGNDDVARMAMTFNRMLDRLEESFATQRRFIDDAGHELRTPITVVRGHLEVMGQDPVENAETKDLVIDELDRMNRIVDELLVLARSERPDFITVGEVNTADLTVDVLAKARMIAPRQWVVDTVADAVVLADGQRLTQALMQLATNAAQHTDSQDRIAVGSVLRGTDLRLWVTDSGPGVAPQDVPHIFQRFRRGTGTRRQEGVGLGLSIVQSIAEAHGGSVQYQPTAGGGATFVLDIPVEVVGLGEDLDGDVAHAPAAGGALEKEAGR